MAPPAFYGSAWKISWEHGTNNEIVQKQGILKEKKYLTDVIVCGLSYCSCEVTASLSLLRQFPFFRQRKCQGQRGGAIRLGDIGYFL